MKIDIFHEIQMKLFISYQNILFCFLDKFFVELEKISGSGENVLPFYYNYPQISVSLHNPIKTLIYQEKPKNENKPLVLEIKFKKFGFISESNIKYSPYLSCKIEMDQFTFKLLKSKNNKLPFISLPLLQGQFKQNYSKIFKTFISSFSVFLPEIKIFIGHSNYKPLLDFVEEFNSNATEEKIENKLEDLEIYSEDDLMNEDLFLKENENFSYISFSEDFDENKPIEDQDIWISWKYPEPRAVYEIKENFFFPFSSQFINKWIESGGRDLLCLLTLEVWEELENKWYTLAKMNVTTTNIQECKFQNLQFSYKWRLKFLFFKKGNGKK